VLHFRIERGDNKRPNGKNILKGGLSLLLLTLATKGFAKEQIADIISATSNATSSGKTAYSHLLDNHSINGEPDGVPDLELYIAPGSPLTNLLAGMLKEGGGVRYEDTDRRGGQIIPYALIDIILPDGRIIHLADLEFLQQYKHLFVRAFADSQSQRGN
jgi:hypothetical protein